MRLFVTGASAIFLVLFIASCGETIVTPPPEEHDPQPTPFGAPVILEVAISLDSTIAIRWYDSNAYDLVDSVKYVIEMAGGAGKFDEVASPSFVFGGQWQWSVRRGTDTATTYSFRMRTISDTDTSAWSHTVSASYGPVLAIGADYGQVAGQTILSASGGVVLWDGKRLTGCGVGVGIASPLAVHKGRVWVGNYSLPEVYVWDAQGTVVENAGTAFGIKVLTVYNDELYAGSISVMNPLPGEYIVRRSTSGWEPVGGGVAGAVHGLCEFNGELYAGGEFRSAEGIQANHIASWNGSRWSPVGSGLSGIVDVLGVHNEQLYAVVRTSYRAGSLEYTVFAWDGVRWNKVGSPFLGMVRFLISHRGRIYVGGSTFLTETSTRSGLISLEGSSWKEVTASSGLYLSAAAVYRGELLLAVSNVGKAMVVSIDFARFLVFSTNASAVGIGPYVTSLAVGSMWTWWRPGT